MGHDEYVPMSTAVAAPLAARATSNGTHDHDAARRLASETCRAMPADAAPELSGDGTEAVGAVPSPEATTSAGGVVDAPVPSDGLIGAVAEATASTDKSGDCVDAPAPSDGLSGGVAEVPGDDADRNPEERQYLDLADRIIREGIKRDDRTGTGTLSIFGAQMRFNLRDGRFPLLTTKKVFTRGIIEELLWFISGSTDGNVLSQKKVHIWEKNGCREFLNKVNLGDNPPGDLGPVYGFQWRHYGAEYRGIAHDYKSDPNNGIDQLANLIAEIKTNPNSRRLIITSWNPCDLGKMALPPCHCLAQFFCANGELSCQLYQRSADMGLGVPFNIASYALLTCMVAHVTGLKPGDFVHTLGDAHVYLNHIEPLKEQIARNSRPFPKLQIVGEVKSINDFKCENFVITGYNSHPAIRMEMSA